MRRFSQDKDISAIKIKPGTLQRFQFFFSAYSPPFHLGFWNNHLHQNGTLKSIYQMYPPLEKVLKLSVDFSFTSSRAIFRIHARTRQLVVHAQCHLHSPTCVDITTMGLRHADRSMETKTGRIFLLKNTSFFTFWEKLS